jgi:hypothetical protein
MAYAYILHSLQLASEQDAWNAPVVSKGNATQTGSQSTLATLAARVRRAVTKNSNNTDDSASNHGQHTASRSASGSGFNTTHSGTAVAVGAHAGAADLRSDADSLMGISVATEPGPYGIGLPGMDIHSSQRVPVPEDLSSTSLLSPAFEHKVAMYRTKQAADKKLAHESTNITDRVWFAKFYTQEGNDHNTIPRREAIAARVREEFALQMSSLLYTPYVSMCRCSLN